MARPRSVATLLPLRPVVYQVLLSLLDGELHGYAMVQDIGRRTASAIDLEPGNLYRHLKGMLDLGLIEESDRRPIRRQDDERRRYYRITKLGRRPPPRRPAGWKACWPTHAPGSRARVRRGNGRPGPPCRTRLPSAAPAVTRAPFASASSRTCWSSSPTCTPRHRALGSGSGGASSSARCGTGSPNGLAARPRSARVPTRETPP